MSAPLTGSLGAAPTRLSARRAGLLLTALALLAVATRAALVWGCARPFGFVWDLGHESAVWTYEHGRLPGPEACWECYQPPLNALLGAPLYAAGAAAGGGSAAGGLRALTLASLVWGAAVVYFTRRLLLMLRLPRGTVLLGTALALAFPCLAITSAGTESDILLAALMSAFFERLCAYAFHPARDDRRAPVLLGLLAGLSALTKYSGLLALPAAAAVIGPRAVRGPRRARAARDGALLLLAAGAVCGGHYAANRLARGRFLLSPPAAPAIFALDPARAARRLARLEWTSLRLAEAADLYRPGQEGTLASRPAYASVPTALHALAWTDMSFFSDPSRHGWVLPVGYGAGGARLPMVAETPGRAPREPVYPRKHIPPGLAALTLRLGLVPTMLAALGLAVGARRRALRPLLAYAGLSTAAYFWWVGAQDSWGLKTKYLLFLFPAYAACAALGLRALARRDARLGRAAAAAFVAALAAAEAFLWAFALG